MSKNERVFNLNSDIDNELFTRNMFTNNLIRVRTATATPAIHATNKSQK